SPPARSLLVLRVEESAPLETAPGPIVTQGRRPLLAARNSWGGESKREAVRLTRAGEIVSRTAWPRRCPGRIGRRYRSGLPISSAAWRNTVILEGCPSLRSTLTMSPELTAFRSAMDTAVQRRCSAHRNFPTLQSTWTTVIRDVCS